MTMPVVFDLSNIINVTIQISQASLTNVNINTAAAVVTDPTPSTWTTGQQFAVYVDPSSVLSDFGINSNAYALANAFFSQVPNPISTGGYLVVIPRQSIVRANITIQNIVYTATAAGAAGDGITIAYTTGAVAGKEVVTVVGQAVSVQISSGVSTAAQIVAAIQASLAANALVHVYTASPATAQTAPVGATNLINGAGETVQAAIARTINAVYYFGVLIDEEENYGTLASATFPALTAYIQGLSKVFFYASSSIPDFQSGGIEYAVQQASENQDRCLYYGNLLPKANGNTQTQIFAASYAGRALSTDFQGSLTASTMNLKPLVGITPDQSLSETTLLQAYAAGVDVYVNTGGLIGLYTSGANTFWDQVYGSFWLKFALQIAGANYLAGTPTKIPQTEDGMDGLKGAYRAVLTQGITNGFLAPGAWQSSTMFGNPADLVRNIADIGYYVYSQPVNQQSAADRVARKAPLVQIAAKLAGAIASSSVVVTVNP